MKTIKKKVADATDDQEEDEESEMLMMMTTTTMGAVVLLKNLKITDGYFGLELLELNLIFFQESKC